MKKDIAERWATELESGKWRQGQEALRTSRKSFEDSYCCLGVLTEMAVEAGVIPAGRISGYDRGSNSRYGYGAELDSLTLCPEVREWAGIQNRWGGLDNDTSLSALNDVGNDFNYIAGFIRKHAERL